MKQQLSEQGGKCQISTLGRPLRALQAMDTWILWPAGSPATISSRGAAQPDLQTRWPWGLMESVVGWEEGVQEGSNCHHLGEEQGGLTGVESGDEDREEEWILQHWQ